MSLQCCLQLVNFSICKHGNKILLTMKYICYSCIYRNFNYDREGLSLLGFIYKYSNIHTDQFLCLFFSKQTDTTPLFIYICICNNNQFY